MARVIHKCRIAGCRKARTWNVDYGIVTIEGFKAMAKVEVCDEHYRIITGKRRDRRKFAEAGEATMAALFRNRQGDN